MSSRHKCPVISTSPSFWARQTKYSFYFNSLVLHDTEGLVVLSLKFHPAADVMVVLVPPLILLHVRRQVGVEEAERRVVEVEPHCHGTLVALVCEKTELNYITAAEKLSSSMDILRLHYVDPLFATLTC